MLSFKSSIAGNVESHQITSAFHSSAPESRSAVRTSSSREKRTGSPSDQLLTTKNSQNSALASDTVPPAVVRSLRNIRKEVIVDMGGRTVVR